MVEQKPENRLVTPPLALAHPSLDSPSPLHDLPREPVPKPPTVKPQPRPQPVPKPALPAVVNDKPVVGRAEYVMIRPDNLKVKARIDTGAGITSLIAANVVRFERDGKPWVRFTVPETNSAADDDSPAQSAHKDSKNGQPPGKVYEKPVKRFIESKPLTGEPQSRPVVELILELGPVKELIDVTLMDKDDNGYQLLIGRNFLRDRAIVDVSRKFSVKTI